MGDAEAAGRALVEIARMAETESRALDRAFRVLGDGALVGPAATRLWEDLARRHAQLRQAFERAFTAVEAIAARGDWPPPRVAMPYLRAAPVPPPRREVVGGDPDLIEILATEVTRAGRSWEDAGAGLRSILARLGADPSPGVAVTVAGDWVAAERRDLLHRRADLLKQVELEALEGGYGEFIQPSTPDASAPAATSPQGPDAAATFSAAATAALGGTATSALAASLPGPPAAAGTSAGAAAKGTTSGPQGGGASAGAAVRALMTRLNPLDQAVRRFETMTMSPDQQVTRGLATRLNRMGLPSLGRSLTSLERDARSFAVGVIESGAGLLKMVWGATPVGSAFNRAVDNAEMVADPAGYNQEALDQLEGLVWGAQHPIEFAKAAADWQTLQEDPARWTGRMTPDALMSAAGGGVAARGWKAAREAGEGAGRVGREMRHARSLSDAARTAGRAAADLANDVARRATQSAQSAIRSTKDITHRVYRTFENNSAADRWGRETWANTIDNLRKLASERFDAVFRYTTNEYRKINGYLRGDPKFDTPEIRELVSRIDAAMLAQPVPEDVVVTRMTDLMEFQEFRENPGVDAAQFVHELKGKTERQRAYLSTALGPEATFDDELDVVISMKVPKGTPGIYVEALTAVPGERELLLGHGLTYKFDDVAVGEDGRYYLDAHIVQGRGE